VGTSRTRANPRGYSQVADNPSRAFLIGEMREIIGPTQLRRVWAYAKGPNQAAQGAAPAVCSQRPCPGHVVTDARCTRNSQSQLTVSPLHNQ
jgi:hypothetical protein